MHVGETGGSGQHASELTLRIVRGLNYLMGEESGLRARVGGTIEVYLQTNSATAPHTSANRGGVALYATGGIDPSRGETYIDDGIAHLDDDNTRETIPLPLQPGTLRVDSARIDTWDEPTKQRIFSLTDYLLRIHFSIDSSGAP